MPDVELYEHQMPVAAPQVAAVTLHLQRSPSDREFLDLLPLSDLPREPPRPQPAALPGRIRLGISVLRRDIRALALRRCPATAVDQIHGLAGKPSIDRLVDAVVLDLRHPSCVNVECVRALGFQCGFDSEAGLTSVSMNRHDTTVCVERRWEVFAGATYAHGYLLEVFNAPRLGYFEIECHSPVATLLPGESLWHTFEDRVRIEKSTPNAA